MIKFGVSNLLFTDDWTAANAKRTIDTAAGLGYDLVEVMLFDPQTTDGRLIRRLAADAGIGVAIGMALGPDADLSSPDPATAKRGEETVAVALGVAAEAGATALSGLTYAALKRYSSPPTASQMTQVVDALGRLDRKAKELGLRLGLEAISRYETYMVNTLDQAAAIIREIGSANMFVHLDTFHANIEENDVGGAIRRNADLLGYVHLAENNRGLPGSGAFDFPALFRALSEIGFDGGVTVETFSSSVLSPGTVGAIGLWRKPWDDAEAAARRSLAFMKEQAEAVRSAGLGRV